MYRILLAALIALFIFSCTSSRTYMVRGDYDRAIQKSVKKLRKNPSKEKEIIVLDKSFRRANEVDQEKIKMLRQEGNPETWDDIYAVYSRLKSRQSLVRPLLPLTIPSTGKTVNFPMVDYDAEIINAKNKAAEYFYTKGKLTLEKGGRFNAREAYDDFARVKSFIPNFRDIDDLMNKAQAQGISYVLFQVKNNSGAILPAGFEQEVKRITVADLNSRWVEFHSREVENIKYPYYVILNIKQLDVSPERVQENAYVETREVQDGFNYVLDKNGNVMKDTAGNDIKVPKMVTISCQIIETHLSKAAVVGGTLDLFNRETGQMEFSEPVRAENFFEHHFARAQGNIKALKPATLKKLESGPVPFPPDADMVFHCAAIIKDVSKGIVSRNRNVFR